MNGIVTLGTVFDATVVALCMVAGIIGWKKRFSGSLALASGVPLAIVVAGRLGPDLARAILRDSPTPFPALVSAVCHAAVWISVLFTTFVAGHLLRKLAEGMGMRGADRLLGLVLALVLTIAIMALGFRTMARTWPSVAFLLDRSSVAAHLLLEMDRHGGFVPEIVARRTGGPEEGGASDLAGRH